jgi:hypothetical protein
MAKTIKPWEAEVDGGSATPTPVKKPKPKVSDTDVDGMKCGGKVKKFARGGGIEIRGKTKGRIV